MKNYVVINHYIVNDEIRQLAIETINSFRNTADVIIVSVDDQSPMKVKEIEELSDIYIPLEANKGFAGSANAGFQWVLDNGPENCYITYSNNDIEVYDGWFEGLTFLEGFGADMMGGLGQRVKPIKPRSDKYLSVGGRWNDWLFPGGFYMTTKAFFEEIGLYDENYKHGGMEDIDLFHRANLAGKKLIMNPQVIYWHKEGATRYSDQEKDKQAKAITKNEAYFAEKWGFDGIRELNNILTHNPINI